METVTVDRALQLNNKLPFINASNNTVFVPGLWWGPHFDESYIAKLQEGGVSAVLASQVCWFYDSTLDALERLANLYQHLARHQNTLQLVTSAEGLENAIKSRKIGIIIQFHNSLMLGSNVGLVDAFYKLGLRVLQLVYVERNAIASGSAEKKDDGLSMFGKRVIERMNELGIILDLAHLAPNSYSDALEATKMTPIVSHSTVRGVCDIPRNMSDEQIKALAKKGGVVGIMAKPNTLKVNGDFTGTTTSDFVDHIKYVADLVGVDHVGIGLENGYGRTREEMEFLRYYHPEVVGTILPKTTDYDHTKKYSARGMEDPSTVKLNIIRELIKRGYSDDEIGKILGNNFIRVFKTAWRT